MQSQEQPPHHLRFHAPHAHLGATFGQDAFGRVAESLARIFGTPHYLLSQSAIVVLWIIVNAVALVHFDKYPFILLNLAFSLQAAYAAPLILLAQTRQAERDKVWSAADARHREELSESSITLLRQNATLLQQNTDLTVQVASLTTEIRQLTEEIHHRVVV